MKYQFYFSKAIVVFVFCLLFKKSESVAQEAKLMLPIGHTMQVTSVSFSYDGKLIVTTSNDKNVKVWDALSGKLILNLIGHTAVVKCASFSPDGKFILTASDDKTAKLWDASNGKLVFEFKGHNDYVEKAIFSPDGKYIITASFDHTAKIWDLQTGNLLVDLVGHKHWISDVTCSLDGKYIATASIDKTAKIWEVKSGRLLVDLVGHDAGIASIAFSPDNKYVVTGSGDNTAKVWDVQNGKLLLNLIGHKNVVIAALFSPNSKFIVTSSFDSTFKIWNANTGQILKDINEGSGALNTATFSPDGKFILTGSADKTAKVWNIESGILLKSFIGHNRGVVDAKFSSNGKYIVTASFDGTAIVWDVNAGKILFNLKGNTSSVNSANYSFDGKFIVTALSDGTAKVWEAQNGKLISNLVGHTKSLNYTSFSPKGNFIITTSEDNTAKIWNARNGNLISSLQGHTDIINIASFSQDEKFIVTASEDNISKVWESKSGKLLADLKGHTKGILNASFSPNGKYIVTASWDNSARVWGVQSGKMLSEMLLHSYPVENAIFSPDGNSILTSSWDNTAKLWNIFTNKLLLNLEGHTDRLTDALFSPDGKFIVTLSRDSTAKVWDALNGNLIADLKGHSDIVLKASFLQDGKYLATISLHNIAKVWNTSNWLIERDLIDNRSNYFEGINLITSHILSCYGSETAIIDFKNGQKNYTFISIDSTDYLVYDEYGRYDGTPAARNLLYFTCGTEIIGLDQVKDSLWVPDLAERIMKGETINAPKLSDLNICGLTPLVEDVSKDTVYKFTITPRRGGLGETVLFVNGNITKTFKPEQLQKTATGYELMVSRNSLQQYLIAGQVNPVSVRSYTAKNDMLSRGVILKVDESKKEVVLPNLYAVVVGVSDYKKADGLNLKYAAKDAQDIGNAISTAAKPLLNTDGKEHVFVYNFNTGTDRYGLPEKKNVAMAFEEISTKATANDILLVFFAGHGAVAESKDNKKQFYFLTSDVSSFADASESGIGSKELIEWIHPAHIKAQKRILMMDACNSGQALNDISGNTQLMAVRNSDKGDEKREIERLNDKAGMVILSASASNQSAYEFGRYSQGLLTYTLLKAIKQQPDILEDGKYLNLNRWFSAAQKSVSQLMRQSGNEGRQEPQLVGNTNFNIGIVNAAVRNTIKLAEEKPMFAGSYFVKAGLHTDPLKLKQAVDKALSTIAQRGERTDIVFQADYDGTDVYALSGDYKIVADNITVSISLLKGGEEAKKFAVSGSADDLQKLVNGIVKKAVEDFGVK